MGEPHWIPQCIEHLRREKHIKQNAIATAAGWTNESNYSLFVNGRKMTAPILRRIDSMLALLGKKLVIVDIDVGEKHLKELHVDIGHAIDREIAHAEKTLRDLHGRKASL